MEQSTKTSGALLLHLGVVAIKKGYARLRLPSWLDIFSLRVFGLFSTCLLLFPQRFSWYVLWLSLCVLRTREHTRNFQLRPLLNPWGSPVLIPLVLTGFKCKILQYYSAPPVRIERATSRWLLRIPTPIKVTLCALQDSLGWIFGTYKLNGLTCLGLLLLYIFFLPVRIFRFFFQSTPFNYLFPYCIHLYSWFTKNEIIAQHISWFLKASNHPMFSSINYLNFFP